MRAEHRAGALRAGQRVGDVAGNVNPAICQPRIEFAEIDSRQRLQRAAPGGDLLALGGQQFRPQRLRHPGAAVIGRTAANTNNDLSYPGVQRMADKLPGTPGSGQQRVTLRRRDALQAAGRRHFDKGALAIAGQPVKCLNRLAQRPGDRQRNQKPAGRRHHGFHRPFPTIGNRQLDVLGVRINLAKALLYRTGHFQRAQALLPGIRCDHYFHLLSLL
ncbi:Uncharacterised protein [Klebsiella pneumoniae]|nr:Uncharacterised protein [Klebsiella pneumoniae]